MNERIKELAEQVDKEFNSPYDRYKAIERFAELIVEECVGVLNKRFMGDLNREDMEVRRCIEDINKHFKDE